jgi:hypothetical protein
MGCQARGIYSRGDQWDVRRGEYTLDVTNGMSGAGNIL